MIIVKYIEFAYRVNQRKTGRCQRCNKKP